MRLFVALDFPEAVRESLRELIARLKPLSRAARWVRPEGMHVTLKFIGETDSQKVVSLRVALGAIHSPQPVEMHFRGLGFFPNERKPRVLWCGVESSSNLAELAAAVERALVPLGFPPEGRDFMPHLTLARFPSPQGAAEGNVSHALGNGRIPVSPDHRATRPDVTSRATRRRTLDQGLKFAGVQLP